MTTPCPSRDEFPRLVDGQLTEDRASAIRKHTSECSACKKELNHSERLLSGIKAPIPGLVPAGGAHKVVASITQDRAVAPPGSGFRLGWVTALAGAAVVIVAVVFVTNIGPTEEFVARGVKAPHSLRRSVGVALFHAGPKPRRLKTNDSIAPTTPLTAAFRNSAKQPAYLLMFAVDSQGDVHWLYPGYTDPNRPPNSVRLAGGTRERFFDESVVLEAPSPGKLTVVSMITTKPLSVAVIERLPKSELEPGKLRRRWPGASVDAVSLTLTRSEGEAR